MPDASEIIHYDVTGVPLYVRSGRLSTYPDMRAVCHWHEDLEFIHVTEGEMNYFISGKKVLLQAGDSLFVNAKQMHYGYSCNRRECLFLCILIHPSLVVQNRQLYDHFLHPLVTDDSFSYVHYQAADPESELFAKQLQSAWEIKEADAPGCQIEIISCLAPLVLQVARNHARTHSAEPAGADPKLLAQKQMVAYIAEHYTEEISLDEIAASASVSKSTCCRLFKAFIHQSPFAYLNAYRLAQSCYLLTETDRGITEIATLCGFNHTSYYTKLFHQSYGCSPRNYRRKSVKHAVSSFSEHG